MRKAFIPEFWITSNIKGDALRTLVAVALHADKHGKSWVKNDTLVDMLDKDIRRIQADLNRGESLGLISRKFDDKGRRFFIINMNDCTGDEKQHPPAQNDVTENNTPCRKVPGGDDELQQGGVTNYDTPPNNPHIGTLYSSTVSIHHQPTHAHAREGQHFVAGSGGGGVVCSAKVKAIALISDAEMDIDNNRLIQSVVSLLEAGRSETEISQSLQGVKEFEKGDMIRNYFTFMSKGIEKKKKQHAEAADKPKRITTKDGKKVLIDGEWLLAKTPYENMPAEPRVESKLGDEFNRFVHEIHGLKLDMDCRIQAEMDLLGIFDQASAGTIDAGQFKQQAASLIQKLKGAVA